MNKEIKYIIDHRGETDGVDWDNCPLKNMLTFCSPRHMIYVMALAYEKGYCEKHKTGDDELIERILEDL